MHRKLTIFGLMAAMAVGSLGCESEVDPVLPGVQALVFARRPFINADGSENVTGGSGQTLDYLRYSPGTGEGGVFLLDPPTPDGTLTDLTAAFEGVDVNGLDVSFDARQVVFSMRHAADNRYHIYTVDLGDQTVRQLTFGDQHDAYPIYLPGDRIAFITNQAYTPMGTRADEYNHSRVVAQIATIDAETGDADRRVCSQNLSHAATMALDHDGTIVFSRWEHLGPVNDVKLFRMNPDCTNMVAVAGQFNKPFNSLVQCQPGEEPGTYSCIGTSRRGTIQAGALIEVDARSATSTNPELYWDVQQARFDNITPGVPTGMDSSINGEGRYRLPRPIEVDGEAGYLVSWADGPVNERLELANTAPNFGIYLFDPESGSRTLVYDNPDTWDLFATPVAPRDEPPVITPVVGANPDPNEPAVIGSIDITSTSLNNRVRGAQFDGTPLGEALQQATRVRIIEGFSSEIGAVGQFGLTMHEGAAILGETPVYEDGSWRAQVPGYLPYHLQPIDRYGLSIRNQMLWIQAMPGETRNCGGCHADRSQVTQPRMGTTTIAQQVGADPSTFITIPERRELPWYGADETANPNIRVVQNVFDRNCVDCHSGGANDPFADRFYTITVDTMEGGAAEAEQGEALTFEIPYLDLSDRLIETYYEMEVVSYPASYVSTMLPANMMDVTAMGDMPPEWIIPGDARRSALIAQMNVAAESDGADLAWSDRPLHPEDTPEWQAEGRTMTRDDRMVLIQMADLGGQYYSRYNVEGGYDWSMAVDY
jgi:hypothetical protein